jgi:two-component system, NarL family, sensor kinase
VARQLRVEELETLKAIAETLNQSHDLHRALDQVIRKLLELTGLQTAWIFLVDEKPHYACVADCNLPPALTWEEKRPMRRGSCWCLSDYWDDRLTAAVNVIDCKRLQDAVKYRWGETEGITHHATVPLTVGGERFGLLNVAGPGKEKFADEELALLESVAYQIGTAVARLRLYDAEQRRAGSFALLGEVSGRLGAVMESERLPAEAVREISQAFRWPSVAVYLREGAGLALRAWSGKEEVRTGWRRYPADRSGPAGIALGTGRTVIVSDTREEPQFRPQGGQPAYRSAIAVPLRVRDEALGVLVVGSTRARAFGEVEQEVVQALADHLSLALENARLQEQRRHYARVEERNRLARDLHDSVTQMLFSLMMTARGARSVLESDPALATGALREMEELSREALKEMRILIWQLRPAGLEEGLLSALQRYGEGLGLSVSAKVEGVRELTRVVEEALWRIGQESLNNVRKHADTETVEIRLQLTETDTFLEIVDQGRGFVQSRRAVGGSLGLISMRERAQALGGRVTIQSHKGAGTTVRVWIPCPSERRE